MSQGLLLAYDFACDLTLEAMLDIFSKGGPWKWELRDSAVYGDYLNTRPAEGVRVRVHRYPQAGALGRFTGLRDEGFSALLAVEAGGSAAQAETDVVFRGLLSLAGATDVTPIDWYD